MEFKLLLFKKKKKKEQKTKETRSKSFDRFGKPNLSSFGAWTEKVKIVVIKLKNICSVRKIAIVY